MIEITFRLLVCIQLDSQVWIFSTSITTIKYSNCCIHIQSVVMIDISLTNTFLLQLTRDYKSICIYEEYFMSTFPVSGELLYLFIMHNTLNGRTSVGV